MIIGTAGHIDHGKTALVRALTGVDTDRLVEEKRRGISIELGYAYQPLADGGVLGFVDVPGHERFVHTMLAGAAGIDFALLVVAADDGIMPQTREHLDIFDLLGVRDGAVAITKIDRVDASRVDEVVDEVDEILILGGLAGAPIFPVSSQTGTGVNALRAYLHAQAEARSARAADGGFRLAVDRSFTLRGIGTVVTGTVFAGRARIGDELTITPSGKPTRLRGLHVMNRPAETGQAGQRCALNLVGVDKEQVARGDWIVAPGLHAPTARFDAELRLLPNSPPLRHWSPVHLHLAADHVTARVALLDGEVLRPGGSALGQLVCDRPLGALWGDGLILRDAEARHTLGGGRVLDPWGPPRRRKTRERLALLAALQIDDAHSRLATLLDDSPSGIDLKHLSLAWNRNDDCAGLLPADAHQAGRIMAYSPRVWQRLRTTLLDGLSRFHDQFPDELGPEAGRARRMVLPQLAVTAYTALVSELTAEGCILRSGPWLHLPGHRVSLTEGERVLFERVRSWLGESPYDPPWVRELAGRAGMQEADMRRLMQKLARLGEVYQVVRDLFYLSAAVARLADIARAMEAECGDVRAADFRDRAGMGRKRCIQVLEFFDRVGYTRRRGDVHRLRNAELFGP